MQYIVQATVSSVYALHHKKAESLHEKQIMTQLVQNACQLCHDERFEMVQRAIVKELCLKHGMEAFNVLAEDNEFRHLIPLYLQPDGEEDEETNLYLEADNLVLCGDSYQRTKDNLQGLTKPGDFPKVFQGMVHEIQQSQDSIFQALLTLSTWTGKGAVSKALRRETFKHMTDRLHTHFAGKSYQQAFSDIADNKLTCKKCEGMSDPLHHKLTELIIAFCLTSHWRADGLLADLHGLISDPKQYQKAFLPTMPASGYFQVKDLLAKDIGAYGLAPKAFVCPNDHLYFIGDCTKPNQSGICPDCQQPIGGLSYDKLHAGSKEGDITEESQAGYKLKSAKDQPPVTPERELSKLSVCALRFCLHAAMLLGSRNGNIVQQMIGNQDPSVFLVQHMIKDLADLAECLGKSIDNATMIMHKILRRMRLSTIPIDQAACSLKTMKARDAWEKEFQRHYLTMVFKDAENIINKARNVMVNAGNMTEKPLESLVFELDLDGNLPEEIVPWDCPCLWKSRKHIDIKHLNLKLEAVDANIEGEGAVLKTILNMENLHLVQHLDVIFDLQSIVMGRYRQKIDLVDADEITVGKFLDDDEYISEAKVDLYIKIWNKIRFSLSKTPSYKPLYAYFKADMDRESPISMCIPSKRGRGRCAYVLVEYLIGKQNDIIQQCRDHIKPKPSFAQMDVPKLSKRDIICISKTDLMPLIQANHQYNNTDNDDQTGPRHRIVYDFGLLEKKIVEKFISRKVEIKCETVPLMQYPQDVGLSKDFVAVQKRINQIPLPVRMCHDIDTFVENSRTANICEAVRTVTIVIQFLAKLGAEGDQTICDYSEKELLLPPEETEMIPRSALISHCLALYERLSWHRSKRLMQNGQNPFENVLECAERIEDEEVEEKLTEELKGMNIERLQLELNAVMMFGPEMQPDWSLGSDVLFYYLEGKHEKADNSWCEKLPEEVLYKHAAHVFELSMELVESN